MTTGTEGNDPLTNDRFVTHEVIEALGGDDTITVVRPDIQTDENPTVTVHGGDGYDTLTMSDTVSGATTSGGVTTFSFYESSSQKYQVIYDGIEEMEVTGILRAGDRVQTGDAHDTLNLTLDVFHLANIWTGGGNDTVILDGLMDYVEVRGGDGNDYIDISAGTTEFLGTYELLGDAGHDTLVGHALAQTFMTGGTGDDNFTINNVDHVVLELEGEGTDTATATVSGYTLADNVENLILSGSVAIGYGNAIANVITGNTAANLLYGYEGDDTLDGGAGNDQLNGGAGIDTMTGGTGDDAYWIDDKGDLVVENAGEGTDKVFSSILRYDLGATVENLQLLGTAVTGFGNALNNVITGTSGNNNLYGLDGNDRLNGLSGADRLSGGDGDDTYFVDDAGDSALESSATGGTDTVYSSVTFNLSYQHLERLFLTGAEKIDAFGNSLDNTITGNGNDNVIDGGGGIDLMNGGGGNDTYIVDNVADGVIEGVSGGADTVRSYVSYHLSDTYEIEDLVLIGTSAINGYGNSMNNRIYGNAAANVLNGGTGRDLMYGGDGNDTYYVDDLNDQAYESSAAGGNDAVFASVFYDLGGQFVETLVLTGTDWIGGFGNSLDNRIYGNSGQNTIDGRTGADRMIGGDGNDTYYVDNAGDRVFEYSGGGLNDVIFTSVSFNLAGLHVETLRLTGTTALTGTGNSLANTIISEAGGSALHGLGGDDVLQSQNSAGSGQHLYGGVGNDTLISTASNEDRFYFDTALDPVNNVDTIQGFDTVGFDQFQLSRSVFTAIEAGVLSADAFHEGTTAADAEDRIVFDVVSGNVFYDADGNGAGEAILFARVDPGVQLDYFHFFGY